MNTPLLMRPLDVRLNVAYIIDTVLNEPQCDPGNTASRLFNDGVHQYSRMWGRIQTIYGQLGWDKLSDREINDIYKSMISVDTKFRGRMVTPMQIMGTKHRWDQYAWTRYESKRNGRRAIAYRWAPMVVLGAFGISLPSA
jgi:hypothetical protein